MLEPSWCVTNHAIEAAGGWHFGAVHAIPVIAAQAFVSEDQVKRIARASELEVALKQHELDEETWVYIGLEDASENSLILSIESARRMTRALLRTLADLDSGAVGPV